MVDTFLFMTISFIAAFLVLAFHSAWEKRYSDYAVIRQTELFDKKEKNDGVDDRNGKKLFEFLKTQIYYSGAYMYSERRGDWVWEKIYFKIGNDVFVLKYLWFGGIGFFNNVEDEHFSIVIDNLDKEHVLFELKNRYESYILEQL